MTNLTRPIRRALLLVPALLAFGLGPPADAQPSTSVPVDAQSSTVGPVVTLNHTTISTGDHVVVTIAGFTSSLVTISVCGNNATRGSADCNMTASEGIKLNSDGTSTLADMPVADPPVSCPCVIRVSSQTYDEVAVAPITLLGHPVEPVVGGPSPDDPLVAVSLSASATSRGVLGWIRSSLGGSVMYRVTVTVKNLTTDTLSHVAASGSVGRSANDSGAAIALADPGEIGPGQTRQQIVSAKLSAPSIGAMKWRVVVSGAGPSVIATVSTQHRPVLLLVLLIMLVLDLGGFVLRRLVRRRADSRPSNKDAAAGVEDAARVLVMTAA